MSKINYVLAKDEDFASNDSDSFIYIGKEPYVEIPHTIQGVQITSYEYMFCSNKTIRGIKSTNKDVVCCKSMFLRYRGKELDLSEFNMISIENTKKMFNSASVESIIWPKDKMPLHLKDINSMFLGLETSTLDLSVFDFSEVADSSGLVYRVEADEITFPTKGLVQMIGASASYTKNRLWCINPKYHTEELCWAAVLADKNQGKHVRIKSKKILMYLGDECPEYVKFYYNN